MSSAFAIELVINGTTYNIDDYKIENNGQRLVVNHSSIKTQAAQNTAHCRPIIKNRGKVSKSIQSYNNRNLNRAKRSQNYRKPKTNSNIPQITRGNTRKNPKVITPSKAYILQNLKEYKRIKQEANQNSEKNEYTESYN